MIYWDRNKECAWRLEQLPPGADKGAYYPLSDEDWRALVDEANSNNQSIVTGASGGPVLTERRVPEYELKQEELIKLHWQLDSTDYCVTKCMELGLSFKDTYPAEAKMRAAARARINELEAEIAKLKETK